MYGFSWQWIHDSPLLTITNVHISIYGSLQYLISVHDWTHLSSERIWVLQMCWCGTVVHLSASSTIASPSIRPNPNLWLTKTKFKNLILLFLRNLLEACKIYYWNLTYQHIINNLLFLTNNYFFCVDISTYNVCWKWVLPSDCPLNMKILL